METITTIFDSLESAGLITLFVMVGAKFITGVTAAIKDNSFEWSKVGDILKDDLLKYVTALVVVYMYREPAIVTPVLAVLSADLVAGLVKNVGKIFPNIGEKLPDSVLNTSRRAVDTPQQIVEK